MVTSPGHRRLTLEMSSAGKLRNLRWPSIAGLVAALCTGVILWLAVPNDSSAQSTSQKERSVEVRFVLSPYADYLFYLLYRSTGEFSQIRSAVPLGDIPSLDQLVSLPEQAASAQIQSYGELYPLVEQYRDAKEPVVRLSVDGVRHFRKLGYGYELPPYQQILEIVRRGESSYPQFLSFWKETIAPAETRVIAAWKRQLEECDPLSELQKIERLSFPFPHLDVAAIALHLSGSGNTFPAGIYTSLGKKPNLAWAVGHEATHLMLDRNLGNNWLDHPLALRATELVKGHGGEQPDIEESLCLFMQLKLSQSCGYDEPSRRMSERFAANVPKGAILRSLEAGWDGYQANSKQDIIDYTLHQTIAAFPTRTN